MPLPLKKSLRPLIIRSPIKQWHLITCYRTFIERKTIFALSKNRRITKIYLKVSSLKSDAKRKKLPSLKITSNLLNEEQPQIYKHFEPQSSPVRHKYLRNKKWLDRYIYKKILTFPLVLKIADLLPFNHNSLK